MPNLVKSWPMGGAAGTPSLSNAQMIGEERKEKIWGNAALSLSKAQMPGEKKRKRERSPREKLAIALTFGLAAVTG